MAGSALVAWCVEYNKHRMPKWYSAVYYYPVLAEQNHWCSLIMLAYPATLTVCLDVI